MKRARTWDMLRFRVGHTDSATAYVAMSSQIQNLGCHTMLA